MFCPQSPKLFRAPRNTRLASHTFVCAAILLGACTPSEEPDASWEVTVTGTETSCVSDTTGYLENYTYDVFQEATQIKIVIDDSLFATGQLRGCFIEYQSAAYLEDAPEGRFTWDISGRADVQGAAGGCELPEGIDWQGTETLTVLDSEHPDIAAGCTYTMSVEGTYKSN